METLIKRLKMSEGLRLEPYQDDKGKWTIGFGHRCSKDHPPISIHEADEYLRQDAYKASDQYMLWKANTGLRLSRTRDEVLVDMIFWHGFAGFRGFKEMIRALIREDYDRAADEMMDSDSGRRYKTRMDELATLMRNG